MTGKRKRDASEFKDPQCDKLKKRMEKLLLEPEIAVFGIQNIKLGYCDNVFTGLARCECMKEFVIGTETRIDLDKLRVHCKRHHAGRESPWSSKRSKKSLPEDLSEKIMEQNAYIMACNNLKASFFNEYDDIMNYFLYF